MNKNQTTNNFKVASALFNYLGSSSQMDQYLGIINNHLTDSDIVVADTGDSCYGSLFLQTKRENGYLAPLFYNTMGFAVPAAIGVQIAETKSRPIVLVGDGAFQMTGIEISTMVKHHLNPIIIIFNNNGYGMQRIFQDGSFNDLGIWNYLKVIDLVGGGKAWKADSPKKLDLALKEARTIQIEPSIIEVVVKKGDISTGLRLFTDAVRREKTGVCPMQNEDAKVCDHLNKCAFCRAPIWK